MRRALRVGFVVVLLAACVLLLTRRFWLVAGIVGGLALYCAVMTWLWMVILRAAGRHARRRDEQAAAELLQLLNRGVPPRRDHFPADGPLPRRDRDPGGTR